MNMTTQGGGPFYSVFECADGEWIQLGCIHSGFVDIAAAALGVAEFIASNPEMGDGRWPRDEEARRRLFAKVAERIRTRCAAEWIAELQAADVPCDRAQTAREAMSDPQILHNGLVRELDDPAFRQDAYDGRADKALPKRRPRYARRGRRRRFVPKICRRRQRRRESRARARRKPNLRETRTGTAAAIRPFRASALWR